MKYEAQIDYIEYLEKKVVELNGKIKTLEMEIAMFKIDRPVCRNTLSIKNNT